MTSEDGNIVTNLVESRLEEMKSPDKFGTRNLFNDLQNKFGTNFNLKFAEIDNNANAKIDYNTNTITLNASIESAYAPTLAHEYLGHVIMDTMPKTSRQTIFDKVVNSQWYKKNEIKLRRAYKGTQNYKSLSQEGKTKYWQSEVINKYLEHMFQSKSNARSVKMINDVYLRNTLLTRLNTKFNKSNELKNINSDLIMSEINSSIEEFLKMTDKNVYKALMRFKNGDVLNKTEQKYYEKYKEMFESVKQGTEQQIAYSKKLENATFDKSKVTHGVDGRIIEDENTKPLFDLARESYQTAEKHFEQVKHKFFTEIAEKYDLSLDIGFANPSIKSVSSFADRLYRNSFNKGMNPKLVKDWIRGSFILNSSSIESVNNLVNDFDRYITNIDVKNNVGYKGIHLNLNYDGIPVEIQLHTRESWNLKIEGDKFYDKYRSVKEKNLSQEEIDNRNMLEKSFDDKWNQLLEDRDFKALRASVSEVKNSMSSSLGSTSHPNTSLTGLDHLPSTNSSRLPNDPLNNLLVGDKINSSADIDNTSQSNNSISQDSKKLNPYETNKAKEIKEGAKEKEGKVISLKSVNDLYDEIEKSISEMVGEDFKVDGKSAKARRLFEEFNILKNSAKKSACKKFVNNILEQDFISSRYIGEGQITYREYLESQGMNVDEMLDQGTELFFELLNEKAIDSNTTKKIERLNQWMVKYHEAKADFKAVMQFVKQLNTIKKNVGQTVKKHGNTGQLDLNSGIKGLFNSYFSKFRFTKGQYLSLTNMKNLQQMIQDGSFNALIDSVINPNNEVSNLPELIDLSETIKDMALELSSSRTTNQKHLNYQQVINFNNLNKADLDAIFALYNGQVKTYVENMSENILGFKVSRENYYPIVGSDAFKIKDFSNPSQMRYNINALNNGRLKKLSNRKTVIEINVNPINLFSSYIESMTITGEIGLESQKLNRLFQLKNSDGESFSTIVNEYLPNASKIYIPSIFNKLIGNTNTIERSSMIDRLCGKFATATLGINVRSMLKQVGSYFTAWGKVGFTTGLKTTLNPASYLRIMKNRSYLKANNPVFKLRIYDNGFVRGSTLSAGAQAFTSDALKKAVDFSLKGMEMMDRFTCYSTFALCEEYVKKTNGYKIGTEDNLKLASEMFSDVILETQSNSDRIAMSRIRSGEKGVLFKNLFGLFQSDSQNKASQIFTGINDLINTEQELKQLKKALSESKLDETRVEIQNEIKRVNKEQSSTYTRMGTYACGIVLSSLVTTLADMLADWLYDKKDPEDEKLSELALQILSNSTLDWIPYFNQFF